MAVLGLILSGMVADKYTSLGPLFEQGTIAYGIGSAFELFYIWNLILTWFGLQCYTGLSKITSNILISIIRLSIQLDSVFLGQLVC